MTVFGPCGDGARSFHLTQTFDQVPSTDPFVTEETAVDTDPLAQGVWYYKFLHTRNDWVGTPPDAPQDEPFNLTGDWGLFEAQMEWPCSSGDPGNLLWGWNQLPSGLDWICKNPIGPFGECWDTTGYGPCLVPDMSNVAMTWTFFRTHELAYSRYGFTVEIWGQMFPFADPP